MRVSILFVGGGVGGEEKLLAFHEYQRVGGDYFGVEIGRRAMTKVSGVVKVV